MADIRAGQIVAFYLFDVAETIDLARVPALVGSTTTQARLAPKPATPAYVQYDKPPLSFDGAAIAIAELEGFQVRLRTYDYGVVSVALSREFTGDWSALLRVGQTLIENDEFEQRAEAVCRRSPDRLGPALSGPRDTLLSEDYLVYVVHELAVAQSGDESMAAHGEEIAGMLRGERQPLSDQEKRQDSPPPHLVPGRRSRRSRPGTPRSSTTRPAARKRRSKSSSSPNSQLLEFRYYDELLDNELAAIYARLQRPRWYDKWIGRRYMRAARQVHALFIDVNELTDRTENALKFVGDIYAARLFAMVANASASRRGRATFRRS